MTPAVPNLFLIGPRGSGKSIVARHLAQRLAWKCVDVDAALEADAGKSIRQIFAEEGQGAFRDREARTLASICTANNQVVATGGGVVLREDNRRLLKRYGRSIWLRADAATLWRRLQADAATAERRPALTPLDQEAEIVELLRVREPLYRDCADWQVDTTGKTPPAIADEI